MGKGFLKVLGVEMRSISKVLTVVSNVDIICFMIKTFKCKQTEQLFNGHYIKKLQRDFQRIALRKLKMLDAATILETLKVPPGNMLEALKRDRDGQHSIRINDKWRICFIWKDGHAFNVEIVD